MEGFKPTPDWHFWILWSLMAIYTITILVFLEYTGL